MLNVNSPWRIDACRQALWQADIDGAAGKATAVVGCADIALLVDLPGPGFSAKQIRQTIGEVIAGRESNLRWQYLGYNIVERAARVFFAPTQTMPLLRPYKKPVSSTRGS